MFDRLKALWTLAGRVDKLKKDLQCKIDAINDSLNLTVRRERNGMTTHIDCFMLADECNERDMVLIKLRMYWKNIAARLSKLESKLTPPKPKRKAAAKKRKAVKK